MRKAKRMSAPSLLIAILAAAFISLVPASNTLTASAYSGQTKSGSSVSNNKTTSKTTGKVTNKTTGTTTSGSSSAKEKKPIISKADGSDSGPAFDKKSKSTPSNAKKNLFGWQLDDVGWWYRIDEKEYIKSGWAAIDGKLYCFNDNGYMVTGWVQIGENWYFLETDGHMVTGNYKIDKIMYHFDRTGKLDLDHYDYGDFPPQT